MDDKIIEKEIQRTRSKVLNDKIRSLSFSKKIDLYKMTIRYYYQGDSWYDAKSYALSLIKGWK